jgi:hypothetical protein
MPTHQGPGPDDRDSPEDRWEPSVQLDQKQAIPIRELGATAYPPSQHNQLMSEGDILMSRFLVAVRLPHAYRVASMCRVGPHSLHRRSPVAGSLRLDVTLPDKHEARVTGCFVSHSRAGFIGIYFLRRYFGHRAGPGVANVRRVGLHPKAGHMTASDLYAAREIISCQAGAIHMKSQVGCSLLQRLEWGRWQVPDGSSASQTTLVSIAAPLI